MNPVMYAISSINQHLGWAISTVRRWDKAHRPSGFTCGGRITHVRQPAVFFQKPSEARIRAGLIGIIQEGCGKGRTASGAIVDKIAVPAVFKIGERNAPAVSEYGGFHDFHKELVISTRVFVYERHEADAIISVAAGL